MAPAKRGLAWPVENTLPTHQFTKPGSKISWLYNWSPHPQPSSTLPFTPMQWNHISASTLSQTLTHSTPSLLAFNEPEFPSQANMSPQLAAETWLTHIEPLRRSGTRCGSPGISSAPEAIPWLQDFLALIRAKGGDVDFWALHWYGEGLGPFYDYIWSAHHRLGPEKPVWITEFACTSWNVESPLGREVVLEFVRGACGYLDGLEWVERYAFFGAMRDTGSVGRWAAMLDEGGGLTEVGRVYRDC
ncbi:MAG: hypothetical protein MMC23_003889 [Stictis urceolatum]|nr:hypothetical protein [Stictis urceolata]